MASITIRNLRNISELVFELPELGVHVLTGINTSGKTTLLTCLKRISDRFAFRTYFRTSTNVQFDNFQSSQIEYENNGDTVTYTYRQTRWSPTPREKVSILNLLGYRSTIFISSTIDRFYIQDEELTTQGIVSATNFFRDSMNEIFETTKYADLRRKKLEGKGRGEGRWNYAFLMPGRTVGGQNTYYSEKNFSLGEVLILNALFELEYIRPNSLVLIDEVELALHPKVQVKFLRFLERISQQKNLTVIISTHSSSLIKAAFNLIYLDRNPANGVVNVVYNCFFAIALRDMAVHEEGQPDIVFYVEDDFAQSVLEQTLEYYFRILNPINRPIIKILPVGGWDNTLRLAANSRGYLIPAHTRVISALDFDVQAELQGIQANPNRTPAQQEILNVYNASMNDTIFLPITPELGIVDLLNNNPHQHIQPVQLLFNDNFDISAIIHAEANRGLNYGNNPRKAAKKRLSYYVDEIKHLTNRDQNYIRMKLAEYYASSYCPTVHPEMQQLFNPIMA